MEDFALKRKAMQMIIAGFHQPVTNYNSQIIKLINNGLGGVIYSDYNYYKNSFKNNIFSPNQVKTLSLELQSSARIPLFISADACGGSINPLKRKYGFEYAIPTHSAMGKKSFIESYICSKNISNLLNDAKINLNFGISLSLKEGKDKQFDRYSFSNKPKELIMFLTNYIKGFQHNYPNNLVCLKDFMKDSYGLDTHLNILKTLVDDKLLDIKMLQVSNNIFNGNYSNVINEIRSTANFNGIIVAEDYETSSINNSMSLTDYLIQGINSGINMFVLSNTNYPNLDQVSKAAQIIVDGVYSNIIDESKIEESYARIIGCKTLNNIS